MILSNWLNQFTHLDDQTEAAIKLIKNINDNQSTFDQALFTAAMNTLKKLQETKYFNLRERVLQEFPENNYSVELIEARLSREIPAESTHYFQNMKLKSIIKTFRINIQRKLGLNSIQETDARCPFCKNLNNFVDCRANTRSLVHISLKHLITTR